jgi:dephospho-CoA kinase
VTLVVGLTGNVAAGKSTVARRFAELGATVIDADLLARQVVAPGTPGLAAVAERFGARVLAADGSLDRAALRSVVFRDREARADLEAITHPRVRAAFAEALAAARARGDRVVVYDVPLLFETGLESAVDRVVLVDAPVAVRRARLVTDRGLAPDEADAMIAAQAPSVGKRARAAVVIDNDGSPAQLRERVDAAWATLVDAA